MSKEIETPFYDSAARNNFWLYEMLETLQYRDLLIHLIRRDVTARYKRSILGIAWTMLNPLGMMVIMSVVFSQVFHRVEGYAAYVLSGLLIWSFFSQSTVTGIHSIVWGGDLFRRIYLPRSIFAVSAIGTALVNLFISLIPYIVVSIIVGRIPNLNFFLVIIPVILVSMFSLGLSLIIASVGVRFPDIVEVYNNILLVAWMYLTPVVYPLDILPPWLLSLEKFNPMFHFIKLFRDPIYFGQPFYPQLLGICTLMALVSFVGGWIIFSRITDEIAYRS